MIDGQIIDPKSLVKSFPHNGTNDANMFADFVYQMVIEGVVKARDVIVMDNASILCYREAAVLEEILWVDSQILIVFMPARSPELNPIELMWHILVQRFLGYITSQNKKSL